MMKIIIKVIVIYISIKLLLLAIYTPAPPCKDFVNEVPLLSPWRCIKLVVDPNK